MAGGAAAATGAADVTAGVVRWLIECGDGDEFATGAVAATGGRGFLAARAVYDGSAGKLGGLLGSAGLCEWEPGGAGFGMAP